MAFTAFVAAALIPFRSAAEESGVLLTEPVPQSRSQLASGVSVEWLSSLSQSLQNSQLNLPTSASVKQVLQHALHKHPSCNMLDLIPQGAWMIKGGKGGFDVPRTLMLAMFIYLKEGQVALFSLMEKILPLEFLINCSRLCQGSE